MSKLTQAVKRFWNDERGISAVEYALIAAVMAVIIAAAFPTLKSFFEKTFEELDDVAAGVGQ